jgi:hypothetical protein
MFRLRFSLLSAALVLGMAALTLDSRAQAPGQGGGQRGQRGQRGGFGRGGFGGFGGPFGSLLGLAANPAVQEELKLDEPQKAKLKSLSDVNKQQSQALFSQFGRGPGQNRGGAPGGGPGQNPGARGNGAGGVNGGGGGFNGGGGGVNPGGGGFNGGGGGFNGGGGGFNRGGGNVNPGQGGNNRNGGQGPGNGRRNRGGFGPGGQVDPAAAQRRQAMFLAMNELRQSTELTLAKILSRGQMNRLRQIQLQLEGPSALVRPEIAEKLNLDELQVGQIRELMNERRQAQRQSFAARGNIFRELRPNNQNAGGGRNAGNAGNNNGGGNGGNGNRGGNRRFDPEAFRKLMEQPEVKAKMEEFRAAQENIENQFLAAVVRLLGPRQRANYKKMVGAPFDRSKMGGRWGGFGGQGGPGNQANTKGAGDEDGDEDTPAVKKAQAAKPAAPAASRPRTRSLRERRGLGGSSDDE